MRGWARTQPGGTLTLTLTLTQTLALTHTRIRFLNIPLSGSVANFRIPTIRFHSIFFTVIQIIVHPIVNP